MRRSGAVGRTRGGGETRLALRAWHLLAAGAASCVAAAAAATVSSQLVVVWAFLTALCVAGCAFTIASRVGRPTLRVWHLLTFAAAAIAAATTAATSASGSQTLAAFACTSCVVAGAFQLGFYAVSQGRRPVGAALRFFARIVRVAAVIAAALAFAGVAIASTLLESGIYKLPRSPHKATPRANAPMATVPDGAIRWRPLRPSARALEQRGGFRRPQT